MFRKARIKLTAWYLLIIMVVSLLFSATIYLGINRELSRIEAQQKLRLAAEQHGLILFFEEFRQQRQHLGLSVPPPLIPINPEMIAQARLRLTSTLVLVNLGILILAGIAGYFLAGKTLRPIQEMVDDQNRFITDASHELRTPLTSLRTELDVALRDKKLVLADARNILKSNLEEVISLQALSDRLLKLTQYQNGGSKLIKKPLMLTEVIDRALKKISPLAKQKEIFIINKTKNYSLSGEKQSLTELFTIILDNAVKYSPQKGRVTLVSKRRDHRIEVSINDKGVGIAKEDLAHIFDRFYRTESSRSKEKFHGYGLGLAIAKQIVEDHGGSITAASEPKKGSEFTITLPLPKIS